MQYTPCNFQIRPGATRKRTIDPHNLTSGNADVNLIPQFCMLELVGLPTGIKKSWFLYGKVYAIGSYENNLNR